MICQSHGLALFATLCFGLASCGPSLPVQLPDGPDGGTGGSGGATGTGGTGGIVNRCADVVCDDDDDGNNCTADVCDPADGQCKTALAELGTPCDADQGTCAGNGDCILAGFSACGEPSQRYEDGDFPPGAWTSTEIVELTEGTASIASVTTEAAGGNPAAFHKVTASLTATAEQRAVLSVAHALIQAFYDPGVDGEICQVRIFVDGTDKHDPIVPHRQGYRPFLLQGGTYYAPPLAMQIVAENEAWVRGAWTKEIFTKWAGAGPATPDFSATGAPIQFGYLTGNSRPITAPGTGAPISAADNFKVEIFPPKP